MRAPPRLPRFYILQYGECIRCSFSNGQVAVLDLYRNRGVLHESSTYMVLSIVVEPFQRVESLAGIESARGTFLGAVGTYLHLTGDEVMLKAWENHNSAH